MNSSNFPSADNAFTSHDHASGQLSPVDPRESASGEPSIQALDPVLYSRLNASLAGAQAETPTQVQSLNALGALIRQWRLHRGLPRQVLGAQLAMEPVQLACVENGIAQVEDFPKEHLLALKALAAADVADPLTAAIDEHLKYFGQ